MSGNFCTGCGTKLIPGAKFCGGCGAPLSAEDTSLANVTFIAQMDCSDFELNNLYNLMWEKIVDEHFLANTPIGRTISRKQDSDPEFSADGDISLVSFEDFTALMKSTVRYGMLNLSFDGTLSADGATSWAELRVALATLRHTTFAANGAWSAFVHAPVSISLESLTLLNEDKPIAVNSRNEMLTYLDQLEDISKTNSEIRNFTSFYSREIALFRADTASRFLQKWFSTELLLTQRVLLAKNSESNYFLAPALDVQNFVWEPKPTNVPTLLEIDRESSPERVYWINPVPKNIYSRHSDWFWPLEDALTESKRRGASGREFTQVGFVTTLWMMNFYVQNEDAKASDFPIIQFLDRHADSLRHMFTLIAGSSHPSFEDGVALLGETGAFIEALPLPGNAKEIWQEYLSMIGLDEGDSPSEALQTEGESTSIEADFRQFLSRAQEVESDPVELQVEDKFVDFLSQFNKEQLSNNLAATFVSDFCDLYLIPRQKFAEAYVLTSLAVHFAEDAATRERLTTSLDISHSQMELLGLSQKRPASFTPNDLDNSPWLTDKSPQACYELWLWSWHNKTPRAYSLAAQAISTKSLGLMLTWLISTAKGALPAMHNESLRETMVAELDAQGGFETIFLNAAWLGLLWPFHYALEQEKSRNVSVLSLTQIQTLNECIGELQRHITKYAISSRLLEKDEARAMAIQQPNKVWGIVMDWTTFAEVNAGFWFKPGFDENCDDHYLSAEPFDEGSFEEPWRFTEVRFTCELCEGSRDLGAEGDCERCSGEGELIFDLTWPNGIVQADLA